MCEENGYQSSFLLRMCEAPLEGEMAVTTMREAEETERAAAEQQ